MAFSRQLHYEQVADRSVTEPWTLLKVHEALLSPDEEPDPCFETFVTSTSEVRFPSLADFILMLLNQAKSGIHLPHA
jgi:hypothetical protein